MNLEEKRKLLEQKKARLQKSQALLKAQERKQKLSKKIKIGELVEKAGLIHLEEPTLLGAFLFLKEHLNSEDALTKWYEEGNKHTSFKKPSNEEGVSLSISFTSPPPAELINTLKAHKFKLNKIRNVWEGRGVKTMLEGIIKKAQGKIEEI